jgi:hypothetical protein
MIFPLEFDELLFEGGCVSTLVRREGVVHGSSASGFSFPSSLGPNY